MAPPLAKDALPNHITCLSCGTFYGESGPRAPGGADFREESALGGADFRRESVFAARLGLMRLRAEGAPCHGCHMR